MTKIEGVKHLPWCRDKYPDYVNCWSAREGKINIQDNCEWFNCDFLKCRRTPKAKGGKR